MTIVRVASSPGEHRIAVTDDGTLLDYAIWRPGAPDGVGDVHRARVLAHVPAMAGAFLALPDSEGFLPDSEGAAGAVEGAVLPVRIVRAALGGKGPRLAAAEASPGPPGLVARGPTPLEELVAAHPGAEILVDDPTVARPGAILVRRAFDERCEESVDALTGPEMTLPGGLRATIHPTPALVAIDMDSAAGTATRAGKESAQMAANLRALPALARAIRLRDLSGAILIDPAGLSVRRRAKLIPALAAALAEDPLRPRLLGVTALGLLELVRTRRRAPLHERLSGPHATGLQALRALAIEAAAAPHVPFGLRCAPTVAAALAADPVALPDLARRTGRPLIPVPDPALSPLGWRIERPA